MINLNLYLNLDEAIDALEGISLKNYLIIRKNRMYDLEELKSFQEDLRECSNKLKGFKIILRESLSMRRALIVILQEKYYRIDSYNKVEIDLKKLINHANSRFKIENRTFEGLNNAQKIHPKNPCSHFEYNPYAKKHYKLSLKILMDPAKIFFHDDEARENLIEIYDEVLFC